MSRIFLSHSSQNNDSAVALYDWLVSQGWDDVFLDLDPERGIAAGARWERSLNQAAQRCEAVLFLVSRAWLDSDWCQKEFNLAHRFNKRLFGLLIEDIPNAELPATLKGTWQLISLASGRDHIPLRVVLPGSHDEIHVTFSKEGLKRLRIGLERAGLDARFFKWPPKEDPKRPPYRGLLPLEAADAGIFFGREGPTVETLDRIRGIKDGAAPRLLVLLGASGAGKSSFLRAGLLPRLVRDDQNYLTLPVIRPERAAIEGKAGLLQSLEIAFAEHGTALPRAEIRQAIEGGAATLKPLLQRLVERVQNSLVADDANAKAPVLVLAIDQGEELFLTDGASESAVLLDLLRELLTDDATALLALITIRSDAYEQLQTAKALEGILQQPLSLTPMPRGAYQAVIEGPVARLKETDRPLIIEPALTQALLSDIEESGGRDALPLLAFTLERLYLEYGASGRLALKDYDALGRIKGSIEAAVKHALRAADDHANIPRDPEVRLALLRRGLIPWLAGIDPDTGSPRRLKARISEIPTQSLPLINLLVEQRLLSTDVADTGERMIEPAHEALLRQWGLLQDWLQEDFAALTNLETVKRAARDWMANAKGDDWLAHRAGRLEDAERLLQRPDLEGRLDTADRIYLSSCRERENAELKEKERILARDLVRSRRIAAVVSVLLLLAVAAGLFAWREQGIAEQNYEAALDQAAGSIGLLVEGYDQGAISTKLMQQLIEKSQKTVEGLPGETDDVTAARVQLLDVMSIANVSLGRVDEAREFARQEYALASGLLAKNPANKLWRRYWAIAEERLAEALFRQGDLNGSLQYARAGEEELARLSEDERAGRADDTATHTKKVDEKLLWQLILAYERIGDNLRAQGDLDGAARQYRIWLEKAKSLQTLDPKNKLWPRAISFAYQRLGDNLQTLGNAREAAEQYRADQTLMMQLAADDPDNAIFLEGLAISCQRLGDTLLAQGDGEGAMAQYRDYREAATKLLKVDASNFRWQELLEFTHQRFGEVLLREKNYDGALAEFRTYLSMAREPRTKIPSNSESLYDGDPSNSESLYDIANAHEKVGDVLREQGNLPDALKEYQEELKTAAILAAKFSNATWKKTLATSHLRIGMILRTQGKTSDALDHFQKCVSAIPAKNTVWTPRSTWPPDLYEYCRQQAVELSDATPTPPLTK